MEPIISRRAKLRIFLLQLRAYLSLSAATWFTTRSLKLVAKLESLKGRLGLGSGVETHTRIDLNSTLRCMREVRDDLSGE